MEFKVRKGLETPLKIQGMFSSYFYVFSIVTGICILIIFGILLRAIQGKGSFVAFIVATLLLSFGILFLRIYLISKSKHNKFKGFKKNATLLSNRDILKILN